MNILQKLKDLFKERVTSQSRLNILKTAIELRYNSELINSSNGLEIEEFFKSEFENSFGEIDINQMNELFKTLALAFHPDKSNGPVEFPLTKECLEYFRSKTTQPGTIFQLLKDAKLKKLQSLQDILPEEANLNLYKKINRFYLKLRTPAYNIVSGSIFQSLHYYTESLVGRLFLPIVLACIIVFNAGLAVILADIEGSVLVFLFMSFFINFGIPIVAQKILFGDARIIDSQTRESVDFTSYPAYFVYTFSLNIYNGLKDIISNPFGIVSDFQTRSQFAKITYFIAYPFIALLAIAANLVVQPVVAIYYTILSIEYLMRLTYLNLLAAPVYLEKNRGHLGSDFVHGVKIILFPLFALKNLAVNVTSDLKDGLIIVAKGSVKIVKGSLVYSKNILSDVFANVIKTAFVIANMVKSVLKRSSVNELPRRQQTLFLTATVEEVDKDKLRATKHVVEEKNIASPLLFSDESAEESFKSSNTNFNTDGIKMGLHQEDKKSTKQNYI